ncbi:hypothetical protein AB6A40_007942 [Gnathostoma spinigerum]|uniref:Phosphatidate cytidylyltransferase, mitochondrial n=1 Tax=Gnathostoma spinigerum TaxID=75299 RepID=A0ABD6EMQ3_9BILA
MKSVAKDVGYLLRCLPLTSVEYAFAYGSGAVSQAGENVAEKMVDFIVVSNDSFKFHEENLKTNPSHYSAVRHYGPRRITQLQRDFGARVFFNTQIKYEGRLMKYGVISSEHLQEDLLDWRWLYIAGRLHKPVVDVILPSPSLSFALKENRASAFQAALLLLPDTFSLQQFFSKIVSLSYNGDFRMWFGEDKRKMDKIVSGNENQFYKLYGDMLENDARVLLRGCRVEQDLSTASIYHRMQLLPSTVLTRLQRASRKRDLRYRDIEEVIFSLAHRFDPHVDIEKAISSIVAHSVSSQTAKNVVTAGCVRSVVYALRKVRRMFSSL